MGLKSSLLYQELTPAELSAIVHRNFNTRAFEAALLDGGMFNTTYRINIDGASYVLRMGPVNRHLLLPFERNLMTGEVEFYRRCREAGLPVSDVIALDTSREIVDRDYMIVRFVENIGMFQLENGGDDWNAVMENIGRFTYRMHQIQGPCFARLSDSVAGRGFDRWSEFILNELSSVTEAFAVSDQYTLEELSQIKETFYRFVPLLDEITVPFLLHVDIWHGNVLVKPDGSNQIAAVIDGDRSIWGDIDFDLQKEWLHNPEFEHGYGQPQIITPQREIRRKLYRILMHMIDGYVWKHEYMMPENGQICHDLAMELIKTLEHQ